MTNKLTIIKGDTASIKCTFTLDGVAINLNGATVFFTVKENLSDPDASAIISKTVTVHDDPTNGITYVDLTSSDTNKTPNEYYWDLKLKQGDGTITSTQYGELVLLDHVTIRTS